MNGKRDDMDTRFEQFYAANFPRVKNFARLLTKSEEDAEDIAQNIFLKVSSINSIYPLVSDSRTL